MVDERRVLAKLEKEFPLDEEGPVPDDIALNHGGRSHRLTYITGTGSRPISQNKPVAEIFTTSRNHELQ